MGCSFIASESEEPPWIFVEIFLSTSRRLRFSAWSARMSMHCRIGRPAEHMEENWRVKREMSLALMPEPSLMLISIGSFFSDTMRMRRPLSISSASAWVFASSLPLTSFPWGVIAL